MIPGPAAATFIRLRNVRKVYRAHGQEFLAVSDVTMDVQEGELVSLVGRPTRPYATTAACFVVGVIVLMVLAVVMQLAGVSALAFAVGVYLPLATTLPIFVGGALRGLVDRARKLTPEESETSPGTLMSTGLIAGGSLWDAVRAGARARPRRSANPCRGTPYRWKPPPDDRGTS